MKTEINNIILEYDGEDVENFIIPVLSNEKDKQCQDIEEEKDKDEV